MTGVQTCALPIYIRISNNSTIPVFVRSIIGISQEAINEKLGQFLNDTTLNSRQQEFLKIIISFVKENGDITIDDLANTEPFESMGAADVFYDNIDTVKDIVYVLHESISSYKTKSDK